MSKHKWKLALLLLVAPAAWIFAVQQKSSTGLTIDPETLNLSTVIEGEFSEFVPVVGRVEPKRTVFVGAVQGGQVEEIFVEDGQDIKEGDLILRLSNDDFLQRSIENESRYITAIQQLRESKDSLLRDKLTQDEQIIDADYEFLLLTRQYGRAKSAIEAGSSAISTADFQDLADRLEYRRKKNEVLVQQLEQERKLRNQQIAQINESLSRSIKNLATIRESFNNLMIHADITGQLSTLSAELGKNISAGQTIGRIDDLSSFAVRAEVDQFYINKITRGQQAGMRLDGTIYELVVNKISPEVVDDKFTVDFDFDNEVPPGVRPGQSLPINLGLSSKEQALLLKKGGYYRETSGRWVFKVSSDGKKAFKQEIRLGRENPDYYEVIDGLKVGDRIITSSYARYIESEILTFDQPL